MQDGFHAKQPQHLFQLDAHGILDEKRQLAAFPEGFQTLETPKSLITICFFRLQNIL